MANVFVITGPSGVGKGTLIRGLLERVPELQLSVSATTRASRPGERDGSHYHFMTPEGPVMTKTLATGGWLDQRRRSNATSSAR